MLKSILNSVTKIAERNMTASLLLNRLWCIYWTTRFKNMYADKGLSYDNFDIEFSKTPPPINDDRVNFIIRILSEKKYERIVEIGAYDLIRPFHYKRLFPEIEIVALDKISGFDPGGVEDGIQYGPFNPDWFANKKGPKTLVIACGTLSYFKPKDLRDFFDILFDNEYDLALTELGSQFAKSSSLRRSYISYYHPYAHMLNEIGFTLSGIPHANHSFSLSGMERREYILASSNN